MRASYRAVRPVLGMSPAAVVPGATHEWNTLTVFSVHDGKIAEHWNTFREVAPGQNPMGN